MELEDIYPWLRKGAAQHRRPDVSYHVDGPDFSKVATEEADVCVPFDEVLGYRPSILTQIYDPTLSPELRAKFLSALSVIPAEKRHNMSDEDLLGLLPSRYNQTLTDQDKLAYDLREYAERSGLLDESPDTKPTEPTEPTEPTVPAASAGDGSAG